MFCRSLVRELAKEQPIRHILCDMSWFFSGEFAIDGR